MRAILEPRSLSGRALISGSRGPQVIPGSCHVNFVVNENFVRGFPQRSFIAIASFHQFSYHHRFGLFQICLKALDKIQSYLIH